MIGYCICFVVDGEKQWLTYFDHNGIPQFTYDGSWAMTFFSRDAMSDALKRIDQSNIFSKEAANP